MKKIIFSLLVIAGSFAANAQVDRSTMPKAGPAPKKPFSANLELKYRTPPNPKIIEPDGPPPSL